jgi:hypothetical protein
MAPEDARAAYPGPEFGRRYYVGGREVTAVKWREYNLLGAPARQIEYRRQQGSRRILPSYDGCGRAVAATLRDGGGTFEKGTLKAVSKVNGYQVGTAHPLAAGTLLKSSPVGQLAEFVRSYAHAAAPLMKKGDFLGSWIDGELFYIEISRHVETFGEAAPLARRHNQDAVFQWDKSLSLPVAAAGGPAPG